MAKAYPAKDSRLTISTGGWFEVELLAAGALQRRRHVQSSTLAASMIQAWHDGTPEEWDAEFGDRGTREEWERGRSQC